MNGSFSVQASKKVLRLFLKLVLKHYKTDKLFNARLTLFPTFGKQIAGLTFIS